MNLMIYVDHCFFSGGETGVWTEYTRWIGGVRRLNRKGNVGFVGTIAYLLYIKLTLYMLDYFQETLIEEKTAKDK